MKISQILCPMRYRWLKTRAAGTGYKVLDVGCGHLSYDVFRSHVPQAEYFGVDKRLANEPLHYEKMNGFFDVDLDKGDLSSIPDDSFDAIVFSHTIEHLERGLEVLSGLVEKLKVGGHIYVEFPTVESMFFPSGEGTLNFFDDPTHVRMYDTREIANLLLSKNVRVLKAGKATTFGRRLLITPIGILYNLYHVARYRRLSAKGLLDYYGFANYVLGVKHDIPPEIRVGNWPRTVNKWRRKTAKLKSSETSSAAP